MAQFPKAPDTIKLTSLLLYDRVAKLWQRGKALIEPLALF